MKNKLASHFQYNVWLYILIVVLVLSFWFLVFEGLAQPKAEEKISFIIFADNGEFSSLQKHLEQNKGEITTQNLKKIVVESQSAQNAMSYEYLSAKMLSNDFLVFQESLLPTKVDDVDKILPTNFFQPFSAEKLQELMGENCSELDFYYYKDQIFGIYLNATDDVVNNFEKQVDSKERFVLFFCHKSVNLNTLFNNDNANNTAGIDVLRYLIGTN